MLGHGDPPGSLERSLKPNPGPAVLTQGHDGEIFAPEFAGDFDFLAERPAVPGVGVMGGGRGVVAHLGPRRQVTLAAVAAGPQEAP